LVTAALFAIGYESWAQRDASAEIYQQMLRLKVLWSLMATLGITFSPCLAILAAKAGGVDKKSINGTL